MQDYITDLILRSSHLNLTNFFVSVVSLNIWTELCGERNENFIFDWFPIKGNKHPLFWRFQNWKFYYLLTRKTKRCKGRKAHPLYIIQDWPKYSFTVTNALSQLSRNSFAFVMSFVLVTSRIPELQYHLSSRFANICSIFCITSEELLLEWIFKIFHIFDRTVVR